MARMGVLVMYYVDVISKGIFLSHDHFKRAQGSDADTAQLIAISDEEHEALISAFSQGHALHAEDGAVTTLAPDGPTIEERRTRAINAIDAAADTARTRDNSIGQLLDVEYQQVIEAHSRWYAEGYDEAKCPEEITAWANAEGISALQAAMGIAEAAAHREGVIRQIRTIRLEGKAAVRGAGDDTDFAAIAQPFIEQLGSISNQ